MTECGGAFEPSMGARLILLETVPAGEQKTDRIGRFRMSIRVGAAVQQHGDAIVPHESVGRIMMGEGHFIGPLRIDVSFGRGDRQQADHQK